MGRKEIREVFGKGRRFESRGAKMFVLKNNLPYNRICFTFSKSKVWNAVSRNRAKRLGREAFRLMKNRVLGGYDLILLIFPVSMDRSESLSDRIAQLESLYKKAGLLK